MRLRLHARHQIGGKHGGRHEQDLAGELQFLDRLFEFDLAEVELTWGIVADGCDAVAAARALLLAGQPGNRGDHIADVNHAARIVQRLVIDRHAAVAVRLEQFQQFAERRLLVDGIYFCAGNHHVVDAHLAQPQDIMQHGALAG